jgi:glycosyltransferase involved in cell wall biosynthesis
MLSAGRLVEGKGHELVLRALAQLTGEGFDIEYTVAGDGPLRTTLDALTRELGLTNHVTFTGAYLHDHLPTMLHETDLFVLPSWPEAFGVVYLEALASGVPVVAADAGGARAFVTPNEDGYLVRRGESSDVARAIRSFMSLDRSQRRAMSSSARKKAMGFTWSRNAHDLCEILAGVVADPTTPRSHP